MANPDWAHELFPDHAKWTRLVALTLAAVKRHDPDARVLDDGGSIELAVDGTKLMMGLFNLARYAAAHDEVEWAAMLDAWVQRVLASVHEQLPGGWEDAAPLLRPQLYNDSRIEAVPTSVVRKLADDLWLGVVIDRPDSMVGVTRAQLEDWCISEDVLFARASANLDAAEVVVQMNDLHAPLVFGNSADDYGSVAMLERLPEMLGDHVKGALVGFPLRTASFVLPLATKPPAESVQRIIVATRSFFERPGTQVTPNLFWWSNGQLELIPCSVDGGALVINMPAHIEPYVM